MAATRRIRWATGLNRSAGLAIGLALAAGGLQGCGSSPERADRGGQADRDTGANPANPGDENDAELAAMVARSAELLDGVFADGVRRPTDLNAYPNRPVSPAVTTIEPIGPETGAATDHSEEPEEVVAAAPVPVDPAAEVEGLARQLVDRLLAKLASSEDPAEEALAVAAIEALVPGVVDANLRGRGELSTAEHRVVEALRDAMSAMRDGRAEPGLVSDRLAELSRALDEHRPVRIADAALCTRVTGFGRYEPFAGRSFLAGRAQPMIVYTQLEGFGHREIRTGDRAIVSGVSAGVSAGDRYLVEVAQTLELYALTSDGDSLLVQKLPAEVDRLSSRNRVRDYYLIRRLDLPATLRAGRYQLKITIEDRVGGTVAEQLIPIDLVADAGLARGG